MVVATTPVHISATLNEDALKDAPVLQDGLAVKFQSTSGGAADHTVRPHFMLYVPAGEVPSPFVALGPFTAEWEGVIHLDLRDRFIFQAELNGSLNLELNGKPVMEATGTGVMIPSMPAVSCSSFLPLITFRNSPGGRWKDCGLISVRECATRKPVYFSCN